MEEETRPKQNPGYLDTTGFRAEKIEIDQEMIDDLRRIYAKIPEKGPMDKEVKKELAAAYLEILKDNTISRETILDYSTLFMNFRRFKFEDELDEVFKVTEEIVKNSNEDNFPIFSKWKYIEDKLNEYVL